MAKTFTVLPALVTCAGDDCAIHELNGLILGRADDPLAQCLRLAPGRTVVGASQHIALPGGGVLADLQNRGAGGGLPAPTALSPRILVAEP